MLPRIYVDHHLRAGDIVELPEAQSRHVQVLRLQPGNALTLFDGRGGEWQARVVRMGRSTVDVVLDGHEAVEREPSRQVVIALGVPANERMDALIEKATELGVAAIQPLACERSVLRLSGERASKRLHHWQAIAVAASEQSRRTRVPQVRAMAPLTDWLAAVASRGVADTRLLLDPGSDRALNDGVLGPMDSTLICLSGPEGGFAASEVEAAARAGFTSVSLGSRVLRADTAPLAVLAWCALQWPTPAGGRTG